METENNPTSLTPPATNPVNSSNPNPPKLDLFDAATTPTKPPDRTLLMPFSQLVEELTNYEKQQVDRNTGFAMTITQLTVDMPIELKVTVNHDGKVNLKGSPPTQLVKTTIMPVFHQMRLTVVREDGDE
ncbi:hypothetical protein [Nostoc sp. CCY 9925]|uniref:hypothetical protein n=1 Tax=Nostoc sp. CCY 9925 TaxID=3103865 RepID=UPI0039C5CFA5